MDPWFLGFFAIAIGYGIYVSRKAGPRQLDEMQLARAVTLLEATPDDPGPGWTELGSRTTADGLRLKFDHDDDPQAEASFTLDGSAKWERGTLGNKITVRLNREFTTHHVHTWGYVFRIRVRGTGRVVGKEIRMKMYVTPGGRPLGGRVENDDDTDAAVGDWIEFESTEVLKVGPKR